MSTSSNGGHNLAPTPMTYRNQFCRADAKKMICLTLHKLGDVNDASEKMLGPWKFQAFMAAIALRDIDQPGGRKLLAMRLSSPMSRFDV